MPYQQLLQQHSRVPSTALPQLLQQALEQVQQRGYAGAEVGGVTCVCGTAGYGIPAWTM